MSYPKEAIEKLAQLVDRSTSAYNWLVENNYRELTVLAEGLGGREGALQWLLDHKHGMLAAFFAAMYDDNGEAFQYLLKNKGTIWAATVNAQRGDKGAKAWLMKNNLQHYAILAEKIAEKFKREGPSDAELLYKPFG
jgi:hypothetical protein